MKSSMMVMVVFFIFLLSGAAAGADNPNHTDNSAPKNGDKPWVRKVAFGILAHGDGGVGSALPPL